MPSIVPTRAHWVYSHRVQIPEISTGELAEIINAGQEVSLIDVREPDEFDTLRALGAVLIPLGDIVERAGELPDGPLHIICGSGFRSMQACEALAPLGHNVTNIAGGTKAWANGGHPTATGSNAQ